MMPVVQLRSLAAELVAGGAGAVLHRPRIAFMRHFPVSVTLVAAMSVAFFHHRHLRTTVAAACIMPAMGMRER